MKSPVLFIVGPTAVGKTETAIRVAQRLNGEIISADSMQVYRGMNIGTAKPSAEELKQIPHHLIDVAEPHQSYSVYQYYQAAIKCMRDITDRGRIPVVVGGTGFYIRSLLNGVAPEIGDPHEIRAQYERLAEDKGLDYLHGKLREIDPERAQKIPSADKKRVIRALEIYHLTGGTKPSAIPATFVTLPQQGFEPAVAGMRCEREALYRRIESRVDAMMKNGLVEECKQLGKDGLSVTAGQAVGYKEIGSYLQGEIKTLAEAVAEIKQNTRHLAKRQLTWFKRESGITWFDALSPHVADDVIAFFLQRKTEKSA